MQKETPQSINNYIKKYCLLSRQDRDRRRSEPKRHSASIQRYSQRTHRTAGIHLKRYANLSLSPLLNILDWGDSIVWGCPLSIVGDQLLMRHSRYSFTTYAWLGLERFLPFIIAQFMSMAKMPRGMAWARPFTNLLICIAWDALNSFVQIIELEGFVGTEFNCLAFGTGQAYGPWNILHSVASVVIAGIIALGSAILFVMIFVFFSRAESHPTLPRRASGIALSVWTPALKSFIFCQRFCAPALSACLQDKLWLHHQ